VIVKHLLALGYQARISTAEERAGLSRRDTHCLTVSGRPFDMISVRLEGGVGPLENLGLRAGTFSIGVLPIASRTVLPIKVHFIVLCEPGQARQDLASTLRLRKQGILHRRVVGGCWEGGPLAAVLNGDPATLNAVVSCIGPRESLTVEPDAGAGCVRIVHRSSRVLDFSLLRKDLVRFHQDLVSRTLLEGIEGVAGQIRDHVGGAVRR